MPGGTIILLGAFAGLTIYLGLPLAFLRKISATRKTFLSMLATGVLLFLLYDVIAQATEPIVQLIVQVRSQHSGGGALFLDIFLVIVGLSFGLIGLVYFKKYITAGFRQKNQPAAHDGIYHASAPSPKVFPTLESSELISTHNSHASVVVATPTVAAVTLAPPNELSPQALACIIAIAIGFHNFSEGLAIGQSAAAGVLQLATVLIVGFGLHNMTEGFGIAGPLAGQSVSWKFVFLVGLIGGGPTFLGTMVGTIVHSPAAFIFCLTFAAGAIIYVIAELLGIAARFKAQDVIVWGLLLGFLLGYMTDLLVTYVGM